MIEGTSAKKYLDLAQGVGSHSKKGKFYRREAQGIKISSERQQLLESLSKDFEQAITAYHHAIENYKKKYSQDFTK